MTAIAEKVLLTVPETADVLRVGRTTVYELFKRGELRWVQVGARRLVTRVEVDRFISEHEEGSADANG
ncbi:excise [Mycobacterium phage dwieneke]|nr:excise [Mycobacterium phage dwieneke]